MDEIKELLKNNSYKSRFMYSPTSRISTQQATPTETILPHLRPFTSAAHPLAQPPQKKPAIQEDNHQSPSDHQNSKATAKRAAGNIDTTLLACQQPQLDARKDCRLLKHEVPVTEPEALDKLRSCEDEARIALALADRELYSTVYRQDFNITRWESAQSSTKNSKEQNFLPNTSTNSRPEHYFTSTRDHHRLQPVIPSLMNSTTRFGYTHRYVKVSKGGVPGADSDMYRSPMYITPHYRSDYTCPRRI